MRFILISATVLTLGLISSAPVVAEDTAQNTPAPQAVTTETNPVICRFIYHDGTVLREARCLTKRQWDAFLVMRQQEIRYLQNKAPTYGK